LNFREFWYRRGPRSLKVEGSCSSSGFILEGKAEVRRKFSGNEGQTARARKIKAKQQLDEKRGGGDGGAEESLK